MIGYGMAKAAVHQLTKSLAGKDGGLPANSVVATILPWVSFFKLFILCTFKKIIQLLMKTWIFRCAKDKVFQIIIYSWIP